MLSEICLRGDNKKKIQIYILFVSRLQNTSTFSHCTMFTDLKKFKYLNGYS